MLYDFFQVCVVCLTFLLALWTTTVHAGVTCNYFGTNAVETGDQQCCDDISAWSVITNDLTAAQPYIDSICANTVLNANGESCSDLADAIFLTIPDFLGVHDPSCDAPTDAPTPSPGLTASTMVISTLDWVPGKCGQATIDPSQFDPTIHIPVSCATLGYHIPTGEVLYGTVFYKPGINAPKQFWEHALVNGICYQQKVETVTQIPGKCARSNYFQSTDQIAWTQPQNQHHFRWWSVDQWSVDYQRPTIDLPNLPRRTSIGVGSGQRKQALLLNGQYPGPLLEMVEGDTVAIGITNKAIMGETVTFHYHGIHQIGTPWADGANMVSEPNTRPGETRWYEWEASPHGTHFAHSHVPMQRARGLVSPILIHQMNDPYRHLYDEDKVIVISDDLQDPSVICDGFVAEYKVSGPGTRGFLSCGVYSTPHSFNGQSGDGSVEKPYPLLDVEEGVCYRMRFIMAASITRLMDIEIPNHNMTILAIDGADVDPMQVDKFRLHQGGRVDALVCMDQEPGMYDVAATYALGCDFVTFGLADTCTHHMFLKYDTFDGPAPNTPSAPEGPIIGTGGAYTADVSEKTLFNFDDFSDILQLNPLKDNSVPATPEHTVTINFGLTGDPFESADQKHVGPYMWYFDEYRPGEQPRPMQLPSIPVMQSKGTGCGFNPDKTPLVTIPETATRVRFVLNNLTPVAHTVHIHGMYAKILQVKYYDWVQGPDQFTFQYDDPVQIAKCEGDGGTVLNADPQYPDAQEGRIWGCIYNDANHASGNNYVNPIERDIFTLPRRGWTVIEVEATNPGIWPFHCHVAEHGAFGASILLKVKESQIPPAPWYYEPMGTPFCPFDDIEPNPNGSRRERSRRGRHHHKNKKRGGGRKDKDRGCNKNSVSSQHECNGDETCEFILNHMDV